MSFLFRLPTQQIRLRKALRKSASGLISEQFSIQNIWSALVDAKVAKIDPQDFTLLFKNLYAGLDLKIIYLSLPIQEASKRIEKRVGGGSRFDGLQQDVICEMLKPYDSLMCELLQAVSNANIEVETLNN